MKFCPNCGSVLEGKLRCNCGYDTLTGEVDEQIYNDFKDNEKFLYEQSYDNVGFMGMTNHYDMFTGAKMMGMNPNLSNEEFLKQMNQPIFNKDNDNLTGEDLTKLMNEFSKGNDSKSSNE